MKFTFPEHTRRALLGLACGDAFGAPFEYHPDASSLAKLSAREGRYLRSGKDVKLHPSRYRLSGLYTDDTQQALVLLWTYQKMVESGKDPLNAHIAARVFKMVCDKMRLAGSGYFGVHRGTGKNFRNAISSGSPIDTAGMGAAMRVGPVATLLPDPQTVVSWITTVSKVTTSNPVALAGAVFFALWCWTRVHDPECETISIEDINRWPKEIDANTWNEFGKVYTILSKQNTAINIEVEILDYVQGTGLANKEMTCAANGFALTGIPWAIYHASRGTHFNPAFQESLVNVCSSGGDTDTVCALTGCLKVLNDNGSWKSGNSSWLLETHPDAYLRSCVPNWMLQQLKGLYYILRPHLWHPIRSEISYTKEDLNLRKSSHA